MSLLGLWRRSWLCLIFTCDLNRLECRSASANAMPALGAGHEQGPASPGEVSPLPAVSYVMGANDPQVTNDGGDTCWSCQVPESS